MEGSPRPIISVVIAVVALVEVVVVHCDVEVLELGVKVNPISGLDAGHRYGDTSTRAGGALGKARDFTVSIGGKACDKSKGGLSTNRDDSSSTGGGCLDGGVFLRL